MDRYSASFGTASTLMPKLNCPFSQYNLVSCHKLLLVSLCLMELFVLVDLGSAFFPSSLFQTNCLKKTIQLLEEISCVKDHKFCPWEDL